MVAPIYKLTLHKTYYENGFFNLGVAVERYIQKEAGPVRIFLGEKGLRIEGRSDRSPNSNGTPRVFGGTPLRDWFFKNYELSEVVDIVINAPDEIKIV